MTLAITPETRVGDLLAAYPALEEVLIAQSPHFAKLRHPVLRRTVARVATLRTAAAAGGLGVAQLVGALRAAAGQAPDAGDPSGADPRGAAAPVAGPPAAAPPPWVAAGREVVRLDVDALLAAGEHPLARVAEALRGAGPDGVVRLTSTFRPEPLLAKLAAEGRRTHVEARDGAWTTYICA